MAIDAGQATIVTANAMGQAMMNWRGQADNQASDGPLKMRPMIPDMVAAMMNVMMIWVTNKYFLLTVHSIPGRIGHRS